LVNYCLRALLEKGLIKYERFRASQNKLRYAYVLTPAGLADRAAITTRFLQRKIAEYERLQAEIEALRAEIGPSSAVNNDALPDRYPAF